MSKAFVDIGDQNAPEGSSAWCRWRHGTLCVVKRRTASEVGGLKYMLIDFQKRGHWKKIVRDDGKRFRSWEEYLLHPEPDGLGMPPASAELIMREKDNSRLLGDVLGEREIGILGGLPGPGRGHKTGSNTTRLIGRGRAYTLARLDRDGLDELAERVRSGELSANAAAIEAGWRKPSTPFDIVLKQLPKLTAAERKKLRKML